jgi:uncharacterized membrane protein HdeD (DUF308 family)
VRARRSLSRGLVALTSVLLLATTLSWYARVAVLDSGEFADRAAASVKDASVRDLIANRVTDQLILRHQADLVGARPIIASAVSGIVGGGAFGSLFRRAVLDLHQAVVHRKTSTATLTVADVGTVAAAALRKLKPKLAAEIDESGRITLLKRHIGSTSNLITRHAELVRSIAWVLAVLTLMAAAGALAASPARRLTVAELGVATIVAGVGIVVVLALARARVLAEVNGVEQRAAAGAVWDTYLGDLRTWGWLLAGSGAIVAAAASSLLRPVQFEARLAAAWRVAAREPSRPVFRLLRALALIAAGLLIVLETSAAVQVAATLAGVYVLYAGVTALLRLISQPAATAGPASRRWLAVPAVAVGLVLVADTAFFASGGGSPAHATIAECNGAATLCGRPLDEIVLPATHNSMSAPLKGWYSSQQDRGIAGQLEDGIRGLLIDTYYGDKLSNGRVRTYFGAARSRALQDGVSKQAYEAALRLRDRAGFKGSGTRGLYLCHSFCELGETPLADGLKDIHDFLVTHPGQVLVVVNQDSIRPADFVAAVGDAGLGPYVFTPPSGTDWPTLRKMIDDDRRLVVLSENEAGAAPWYQLAYERLLEETPFKFSRPAQLADTASSCKPKRGPPNAPLFLLNNWITTDPLPRPSNASKVNAYATLLARARACERMRRHVMNLIAVDFYKRGDIFRVVKALNGG